MTDRERNLRDRSPVLQTKHPRQLWIKQTYVDFNAADNNYSAGEITEFIPIDDSGEESLTAERLYKGMTVINNMAFTFDIKATSLLDAKNGFDAALRAQFAKDYALAREAALKRELLGPTGQPLSKPQ